jgi:hypothetical protein
VLSLSPSPSGEAPSLAHLREEGTPSTKWLKPESPSCDSGDHRTCGRDRQLGRSGCHKSPGLCHLLAPGRVLGWAAGPCTGPPSAEVISHDGRPLPPAWTFCAFHSSPLRHLLLGEGHPDSYLVPLKPNLPQQSDHVTMASLSHPCAVHVVCLDPPLLLCSLLGTMSIFLSPGSAPDLFCVGYFPDGVLQRLALNRDPPEWLGLQA